MKPKVEKAKSPRLATRAAGRGDQPKKKGWWPQDKKSADVIFSAAPFQITRIEDDYTEIELKSDDKPQQKSDIFQKISETRRGDEKLVILVVTNKNFIHVKDQIAHQAHESTIRNAPIQGSTVFNILFITFFIAHTAYVDTGNTAYIVLFIEEENQQDITNILKRLIDIIRNKDIKSLMIIKEFGNCAIDYLRQNSKINLILI